MRVERFLRAAMLATAVLTAGSAAAQNRQSAIKQIYFGDLHTHTNISADAVVMQLAHGVERGPEMVCTYAAACAAVDFYGQSDHAEMTDLEDWQRIQSAVTRCNEAGSLRAPVGADPAIVAFQGFEWTSSAKGIYWGHKNVFFKNDIVPDMPVAAIAIGEMEARRIKGVRVINKLMRPLKPKWSSRWGAFKRAFKVNKRERCVDGVYDDDPCILVAPEPKDLFAILNSYYETHPGYDTMVIPHGTAWGTAKLGANWDIQLNKTQHDPNLQTVVEVYSGHGNSEEWRDFSDPESGYQSCADRAAELQQQRCDQKMTPVEKCREQVDAARASAEVEFETSPADWGDCGQCIDCFQPAERYQPDGSVQAALAKTGFDSYGNQTRFHWGFIAATDDHAGKPASVMEDRNIADWGLALAFQGAFYSEFIPDGRNRIEAERLASYFYPGGLVAIHAENRTRDSLWRGLQRREVYGTSGPRIELWFDATAGDERVTMGGRVTGTTSPRFEVTVQGAPVELPGCSKATLNTWGEDVVNGVCQNVCFNPGDERVGIDRVEIVRIRPQRSADESLSTLIEDPWRVIKNPDTDAEGQPTARMVAQFADPGFIDGRRDAIYYVRAIQVATPSVNGVPLRNAAGDYETCPLYPDPAQPCITPVEERAWSSPIYVDYR